VKREDIPLALSLLQENIDRYERLQDPTPHEVQMYRSLWFVFCELQDQQKIYDMAAVLEVHEASEKN